MVTPVSEKLNLEFKAGIESEVNVIDLDTFETIKNKVISIFEEDKKLDYPVFLFIKPEVVTRLAHFLIGTYKRSVAIGIAGETASGKSTFTMDVIESLLGFQERINLNSLITRVNTDDYYYDRSEMVIAAGGFANFAKNYDLDVPEAFELDLLKRHIEQLVVGNPVMLPKYDMSGTAKRYDNHTLAIPGKIIISEGLFNLTDQIKDAFDFCIYVDVSGNLQKERFFKRAGERGLGDAAINIYNNAVEKAEIYIKPSAENADIIVNGEAEREDYKNTANKFLAIVEEMFFLQKVK